MIDFEALLNSLFDIVHVTDAEGKTIYCSEKYEDFFGVSPKEMVGRNIEDFYKLGYFKPTITMRVIRERKRVHTIQTTFQNRKLFVVGTPIFDCNGTFIGVVNTSTDITNQEKLQNELNEVKNLGTLYFEEIAKFTNEKKEEAPFIYRSSVMEKIVEMAKRLAQVDSTVILLGESGVGKGILAKYIHQNSTRRNQPFVQINCGAIPSTLLESELFGYERGAFTGADKEGKVGLFEKADGGTLFLDEIGELSLNLQVKLLNALQEKTITRLGGSTPKKIDIRLIAATNKNLKKMVEQGEFREDLYYRIHVIPLEIPPLRERPEEIPLLVRYFLDFYSRKYCLNKQLSDKCYHILERYHWPGNVRELENVIERLVVISNGDIITSEQIPSYINNPLHCQNKLRLYDLMPVSDAFEEVEKQLLQRAYDLYKTTTKVAEVLGISQPTVSRKLKKYGIH
ncbi:sigma-54 interaction domain-containing protein [Brevibacillus massiliensis]|uniref:sigma-54 interaction domain-containing protein n=1 Tax=Brevibacillus massiliensis TaxID=1118054 RepID=UPI0004752058